uniref:Uncharacterized protein n=1 Tax=Timema genevievae TaxID=629358 RepID=A0A7R9JW86_TIMGE|nr:unnamed protein product [Timema genevievae]
MNKVKIEKAFEIHIEEDVRDLYELLLQKEALENRLGQHEVVRKSNRSPSLRLRFGRRADPSIAQSSLVYCENDALNHTANKAGWGKVSSDYNNNAIIRGVFSPVFSRSSVVERKYNVNEILKAVSEYEDNILANSEAELRAELILWLRKWEIIQSDSGIIPENAVQALQQCDKAFFLNAAAFADHSSIEVPSEN